MHIGKRLESPVTLLPLLVVLAGLPLGVLGWVGSQLIARDRALDAQRVRERLEHASALVTAELDRGLSAWGSLLPAAARGESVSLPPDAVFILIGSRGTLRHDGVRLRYYPVVPAPGRDHTGAFAEAELLEFGFRRNLPGAAAAYRALARSHDMSVRAGALVRLARVLRQEQRAVEALAVYDRLAAMGDTIVAGSPAELVARRERMVVLTTTRDSDDAAREATRLAVVLADGRHVIDRATYDFFNESLPASQRLAADGLRHRLAAAVEELWPTFTQQETGRVASTHGADAAGVVSVWQRTSSGTAVIVAGTEQLFLPVLDMSTKLGIRVTLGDSDHAISGGSAGVAESRLTRTAAETGLPWAMQVTLVDRNSMEAVAASRRRLWAASFGLMVLMMAAAGYVVFRSVTKELTVARLQADFVAAVSHEFRTPLAAMCHLAEMLEGGGTPSERLPLYYRALGKESRRLRGLVESLLDFGRIESGRRRYDLSDLDATEFLQHALEEFRDQGGSAAHRVQLEPTVPGGTVHIRADKDALALALRSLLDNAVKYSPEPSPVTVGLESRNRFVGIAVQDKGPGIPPDEQRAIFNKFTRGSAARAMNVKGTGIGLTMAAEIVKAHGGRLELVSEPGAGARFVALLPAVKSRA